MSPSIEDVRNYISIKPVPVWEEAVGSKLQARSLQNYTLARPTRQQVFKSNYTRRLYQMTAQGYQSVPWKPYQEVGKPLYLSSRTLVQTSLGQRSGDCEKPDGEKQTVKKYKPTEYKDRAKVSLKSPTVSETDVSSSNAQSEDEKSQKSAKIMSTASFLMKHRQHKDLQNLVKDLTAVRDNLSRVKMGHALFPMLQKEHNERNNAFLVDRQNEIRNSRQGMRIQSLTSEDQDELKQRQTLATKQMSLRRAGSRASMMSMTSVTSSNSASPSMVARRAEVTKSLAEQARPFTPVHSNISLQVEEGNVHFSVWKQLCVLHWIMEACQLESNPDNQHPHKVMIPLSDCWDELNPGGRTRDYSIVQLERRNNSKWTRFMKNPHKLGPRSKSRRKQFYAPGLKRNTSLASELGTYQGEASARQRPPSARSVMLNLDGSNDYFDGDYPGVRPSRPSSPGQSSVTTTIAGGTVAESEYGDDDMDAGFPGNQSVECERRKEQEDWFNEQDHHEHLRKLLSTVKESVTKEMQHRERTAYVVAEANHCLPLSVYEWARNSYFKIGNKEVNISKIVVPAATPVTDYSEVAPKSIMKKAPSTTRIRPQTAVASRRRDSLTQAAGETASRPGTAVATAKPKRPMSSPAKLSSQFTFKFSSAEKEKNLGQIREEFDEVNDTKALQLHNQLTELEKRRKQRMEIKFDTLSKTSHMHRDLKGMRKAAHDKFMADKLSKQKRSCMMPCDWYETLAQNLPDDIHDDENCNVILQKLAVMGITMVEEMRRVTPDAFLKALQGLRPWELCSPDVSGAIEFVRESVVQMDPREFDEWRAARLSQKDPIVGSDSK